MRLPTFVFALALICAVPAVVIAPAAHAQSEPGSASLAAAIVNGVKQAIQSSDPKTLQANTESFLESALATARATPGVASAALNIAEARLKADGQWTPPIAAAFATARRAIAALISPSAGVGNGVSLLGAPPINAGGGSGQTGTYGQP
ncbi:hypothetical protein [Caulobacter sp.]|uniref:hypothetical protein n=1 Tax=Caulobacter sp. TaxID=78 RepID=UPI003BAB860C